MRAVFASCALVLLGADTTDAPDIHRIELWAPGLEVQIDSPGHGRFWTRWLRKEGRFVLAPARFVEIRQRLEPFRRSHDTYPQTALHERVLQPCRGSYRTDQGGVTIHWSGAALSQWYLADFGCRSEENAARYQALRTILALLPVPDPDGLP